MAKMKNIYGKIDDEWMVRYNVALNQIEYNDSGTWIPIEGDGTSICRIPYMVRYDHDEGKLQYLVGEVWTTVSMIEHMKGDISLLQGRVDGHDGNISILEGNVQGHDGMISSLQGRVGGHDTDIQGLQGITQGNRGNISILQGRVGVHDGNIGALEGRVDGHDGNISILEGNIVSHNGRIVALDHAKDIASRLTYSGSDWLNVDAINLTVGRSTSGGSGAIELYSDYTAGGSAWKIYSDQNRQRLGLYNYAPVDKGIPFYIDTDEARVYMRDSVGIGTASPAAKLDVDGNARIRSHTVIDSHLTVANTILSRNTSNGSGAVNLQSVTNGVDNSYWGLLATNDGRLIVHDYALGAGTRMSVTSSGDVGIGTASPAAKLDVDGTTRLRSRLGVGPDANPTADIPVQHVFPHGGTWQMLLENSYPSSTLGHVSLTMKTQTQERLIQLDKRYGLGVYDRDGSTWRMMIADGGNVGIGTTGPTAKLDVNGNARIRGPLDVEDAITTKSGANHSRRAKLQYNSLTWTSTARNVALVNDETYGVGLYHHAPNAGWSLCVNDNKDVCIGGAVPTAKLDVMGDVRIRGNLVINGTNTRITQHAYTSTIPYEINEINLGTFKTGETRTYEMERYGGNSDIIIQNTSDVERFILAYAHVFAVVDWDTDTLKDEIKTLSRVLPPNTTYTWTPISGNEVRHIHLRITRIVLYD